MANIVPARHRGATLAELMTALAIAAILVGVAAPNMATLVSGREADAAIERQRAAVQMARQFAVARRTTATLCPASGETCGRRDTWHDGALVFLDANGNARRDPGEAILHRMAPLPAGYRLTWRSFRNRTSLSMRPTGLTDRQNGSMLLCPPDGEPANARLLVVNAQGRTRLARDSDGDGIVERANGRAVAC